MPPECGDVEEHGEMYEHNTVGAVIPAYNEEGFIGDVLDSLPEYIDRAYVIDDGSTDGTWAEICERAEDDSLEADGGTAVRPKTPVSDLRGSTKPVVIPIRHTVNQGVGGAIKTGYRHALRDRMDVTTVIAGDGQTEPDIVERIVRPVATQRVDYAKGNRMLTREGMPRLRQFGNFTLAVLTKIASGYWKVNDPQNGSTAISLEALEAIDIDALYDGYGFTNDLLVRLNVHNMRVADVPRRAVYKDETSHIKFKSFVVTVSLLLLRDFIWRLRVKYLERDFHPLALFYGLGVMAALGGIGGTIRQLRADEASASGRSGITLFFLGWLFVGLAMVFDLQENEDLQETSDFEFDPP